MDINELEYLSKALEQATKLKSLLESEFDALKTQDLTAFEEMQPKKVEILTYLASESLAERVTQIN